MDPVTLGVLAVLLVGIVGLVVLALVVRAWIRTLKWMIKLAFYATVTLLVVSAIGAGVAWVVYGDQLRAMWAASGA